MPSAAPSSPSLDSSATARQDLAGSSPDASPPDASPPGPPVIELFQVHKVYRTGWIRRRSLTALDGVTLQVHPGEIFGLLGPNGAGKTTLIKILLGVIRRSGGRARLLGQPAGSTRSRRRVGYLPESLRVDRHHTARSALRLYGHLSGLSGAALTRRIDHLLERVGLQGRDREPVRGFSKGMQQRLGLAQALLHDPDLLILDEPTDGLDPVGRSDIRTLLTELRAEGKTVFLNSHILQEVELVCDRVAVLSQGRLRGVGSIESLTNPDREAVLHLDVGVEEVAAATERLQPAVATAQPVAARGLVRLTLPVSGQEEVDRCVDALRGGGISLVRMELHRPTLEEVFLSMIRQSEDGALESGPALRHDR